MEMTREEWHDWARAIEEPMPKMVHVWGFGWVTQREANRLMQNVANQSGAMYRGLSHSAGFDLVAGIGGCGSSLFGGTCPSCGK